jgi:hypothetical protein
MGGVPLENWGGMGKLWSVERGVCDAGSLACNDTRGPICEDLGDPALMASFPRAMFELVAPPPANVEKPSAPSMLATVVASSLPIDAFADEGPGVVADTALALVAQPEAATADIAIAGGTPESVGKLRWDTPELRADPRGAEPGAPGPVALLLCPMDAATSEASSLRAKLSYCSYEEPNTCKCPVAALTSASGGYGATGPSMLE